MDQEVVEFFLEHGPHSGRECLQIPNSKSITDSAHSGPQPANSVAGSSGSVTGWAGIIKVDGTSYTWMGNPGATSATQMSFEYTSTRSTFILDVVGKVSMNVTFLSPVTPSDLKRQSVIGSYLHVTVAASDGSSHSVQLYADTSAGE